MKNLSSSELGRSMVEMLGVLAIIGVLTVGAMSGITFGLTSFRAQMVYDQVESAANAVTDLFSWYRDYPSGEDFTNTICGKGNVFESECESGKAGVKTVFTDSFIEVVPNDEHGFVITVSNVPKDACERLADMAWVNVQPADSNSNCGATNNLTYTP